MISRGTRHMSTNRWLKSVTVPRASVTRIPSHVDSSVARIIARDPASSCVLRSSSSFARSISCSARWRASRMLFAFCRATERSSSSSSSRHQRPPIMSAASAVPSTRARIFANAVSRLVDVSSLNGENPQSSVVPSCSDRDVLGRFEDPVPDLLRRLDARVDRGDDADEDPLVRLHVPPDDPQHAGAVLLARQRDVEVPRLQLEQAGQQLVVVDVRAVGRVAVAARAGMHADAPALLGREPGQRQVVQVDEAVEQMPGRVDLHREAALREVDLHLVRALRADSGGSRSRARPAGRR